MKSFLFLSVFCLLSMVGISQNKALAMKELLSEYEYKTHYVTLDSLEVAYVKEGNHEQTLLFVHGLSSNADAWSKNIQELKDKYTCIALDLPGFGKSSIVETQYTSTFFADVVHQFILELKLKNVILVGHSMGGQASVKLAVNHPEAISKLVLVAPAGIERFSEAEANLMKGAMTEAVVKGTTDAQIERNYALNFFQQPKEVGKMIAERKRIREAVDFDEHCKAIVSSVWGMLDDPVFEDLQRIQCPVLVIFGNNDKLIPNGYLHPQLTTQAVAQSAKEEIKHVEVKMIGESGHFVQFEKPMEVNAFLTQFVETP
ncbi:alpha/beta fold hydrolase [Mangrovimonas sp. YM274]|uniref:alpha/beta fold hydrolase n=1 Tax=Mangrovimonas sp. YM274 TaxID=3070660 RepID=UPI0027DDE358|nr:alpha/beta hydrolase [Mangrovimonas sp. YM274]WMI68307.1 alpha/beta hydrolase [Mangrovimonas sp. YM274]